MGRRWQARVLVPPANTGHEGDTVGGADRVVNLENFENLFDGASAPTRPSGAICGVPWLVTLDGGGLWGGWGRCSQD